MRFDIFTIPTSAPEAPLAELNAFVASHTVTGVVWKWIHAGECSRWVVRVTTTGAPSAATAPSQQAQRDGKAIDYRQVLSAEEFQRYASIRAWRKSVAAADNVPVYTVLTNEQMAEIVRRRARTKHDLESIEGIGTARLARISERLLATLADLHPSQPTLL